MVSQYVQGHLEISDAVGTVTVVYSVVPGQANASEQLLHTPFPQGDANILENALPTIRVGVVLTDLSRALLTALSRCDF